MRSLFIGVVSLFSAFHVFASTIMWDVAEIDKDDVGTKIENVLRCGTYGAGFALRLYYEDIVDMSDNWFREVAPDSSGGAAFGMNIREMQVGDTVSEETVRGYWHSYFYANWIDAEPGYDGGSPETSSLSLYPDEEVYLGFVTHGYVPLGAEPLYIYGWFSLIFDGTDIRVGQSAMDISGAPIVILPRQIPEPGTLSLVLFGIVALSMRRRV
jgi:hypothetical protein